MGSRVHQVVAAAHRSEITGSQLVQREVDGAACLDVALSHLPRPDATFALGIDAPLYLSVHSATARLAPAGAALVSTMKYLSPDEPADSARDERQSVG